MNSERAKFPQHTEQPDLPGFSEEPKQARPPKPELTDSEIEDEAEYLWLDNKWQKRYPPDPEAQPSWK